jgi:glycine cleavage system protein P-like pyridoxal-binding family
VNDKLAPFLPGHSQQGNGANAVSAAPLGSASILLISYAYIKMLGAEGLALSTAYAILNANYMKARLEKNYTILYAGKNGTCAHEFIIDLRPFKASAGIEAEDVAKRLIDFGFHAPTVAFPEQYGLMIEPTETYSKKELDQFVTVVESILKLVVDHPEVLKTVPHFTPIDRVDEVQANKSPVLSEKITSHLPTIIPDRIDAEKLRNSTPGDLCEQILMAHRNTL